MKKRMENTINDSNFIVILFIPKFEKSNPKQNFLNGSFLSFVL